MPDRMRVALVHSFYSSRQPSGENNVVRAEAAALRRAGHEVDLLSVATDDLAGRPTYALRAAARVATGRGRDPLGELERFGPDVVHVHNLFPNLGRRWVSELSAGLVHTLHNYRPLCANGRLLRDGAICTLCPDGRRWAGVRYACYRDSRLATLPIAWANRHGPRADPVIARADRLVLLSERQAALYRRAGLPGDRMTIWPNFLPDDLDPGTGTGAGGDVWLYVGRLSKEKGILELLRRWPPEIPLRVAGDGALRDRVEAAAGPAVQVLGAVDRGRVLELMRASVGLVFPSLWYEPAAAPLVYVEALAAGLPVLALPPSPVAESVVRDGTGEVVSWDDDLALILPGAAERLAGLRSRCREVFEQAHTEAAYVAQAVSVYERVVAEHGGAAS